MAGIIEWSIGSRIRRSWDLSVIYAFRHNRALTRPDIVIHDENPVKQRRELGDIVDGSTVLANKGSWLGCSGDDSICRQLASQKTQERKEVGRVEVGYSVVGIAFVAWILPVDVDAVDTKLLVCRDDVLYKDMPIFIVGDCVGEMPANNEKVLMKFRRILTCCQSILRYSA